MAKVVIENQEVDFDGAVALMDDEVRETVHATFDGDSEQEFLDAYRAAHIAKFGTEFAVN